VPLAQHTFAAPFDGLVALRVTDSAGESALATTVGHASADGDEIAAADDNCPMIDNRDQADYDEDGVGDACDLTPGYPQHDLGGGSDSGTPVATAPAPGTHPISGSSPGPPSKDPYRSRRAPTIGMPRLASDGRQIILRITCRRTTSPCVGTIRALLGGRSSRVRHRVRAGRTRPVTLRVPAPARRSLLRGSTLRLRLTATTYEGRRVTRTASVRMRRAR
jgi:hypothetical protein